MTDPDAPRRRFGEKEVGLILKRATELQTEAPDVLEEGEGLTLTELEEIAVEAGIDARFLRRAAKELDTVGPPPQGIHKLAGGPVTIELERRLQGEVPERAFEEMLRDIQLAAEGAGQGSLIGRTLAWSSTDPNKQRSLQIVVRSGDGETIIRIEERLHAMAGALFGGLMGGVGGGVGIGVGVGVGLGALGSALFATVFPLGIVGISYITARSIFGSAARRRQKVLSQLAERLATYVREAPEPPMLAESSDSSTSNEEQE